MQVDPISRPDAEDTPARGLSQAIESLSQLRVDMPIEYMRAWLSLIAHGEFDALTFNALAIDGPSVDAGMVDHRDY